MEAVLEVLSNQVLPEFQTGERVLMNYARKDKEHQLTTGGPVPELLMEIGKRFCSIRKASLCVKILSFQLKSRLSVKIIDFELKAVVVLKG